MLIKFEARFKLFTLLIASSCCLLPLFSTAAAIKENDIRVLDEIRGFIAAEDWASAQEHLNFAWQRNLQGELPTIEQAQDLQELQEKVFAGIYRDSEKKKGIQLLRKAKSALSARHLKSALVALQKARLSFERAGWKPGCQEVKSLSQMVEDWVNNDVTGLTIVAKVQTALSEDNLDDARRLMRELQVFASKGLHEMKLLQILEDLEKALRVGL